MAVSSASPAQPIPLPELRVWFGLKSVCLQSSGCGEPLVPALFVHGGCGVDACTGSAVLGAAGDRARACSTLLSHWRCCSWMLGSIFGFSSIAHPCYAHTLLPGPHAGLWVLAGTESRIHPPMDWGCCPHRPWELPGTTHLHNQDACALASQHGCKLFRASEGTGSDLKTASFPTATITPMQRYGKHNTA